MSNPFDNAAVGRSSPAVDAVEITPNDSTDLESYPRSLLLSADGDVKVTTIEGTVVTLPLVKGFNPIGVKRVWATGTDAVDIFGLY